MIITMPTVRHTGSQYVRQLLRSALPEHTLRSEPDHGFVTDHTYGGHMPAFRQWLEASDLVVIPLRNPARVANSWAKSSRDPSFYHHWHEMWENLMILYAAALSNKAKVITIPVDLKADKYRPIRELERFIGHRFPEELLSNVENPGKYNFPNPPPEWEPIMPFPLIQDHYNKG